MRMVEFLEGWYNVAGNKGYIIFPGSRLAENNVQVFDGEVEWDGRII